ncbi:sodium/glutamate symporter [Stenotrophomonas sp. MH1]|uniref:Sodium/glutamate symporter n=1 Tax=Stenotrophomonas capsici TaxID=3110230 RepID=A0ABU5UYD4_9GAMM|nr:MULTISPECIES: sodium/glutamate symporter [unclassified Stenotrophomonas]MBD9536601.1 sodium/glutamate symporter [Stenotrophomonas sp. STM01]MEA5666100.1 sodium/glutamate symporter [Stenotrophomonas sp. MH1]
MIHLDAVQTVAFAGLTLFAGYALCRVIPFFRRYNLPEPVVGGLLVALAVWWAHGQQTTLFELDTTLKTPLMVAFFTTLGINASVRLLRVSGKQVMLFLLIGSVFAVLQNLIGISVAKLFGLNPMFGVLAGSATLTGGPATGLAFAPLFEKAGLAGAESLAVTAAMAGIICGGLVGGPVITVLMQRFKVQHPNKKVTEAEQLAEESVVVRYPSESAREFDALKSIVVLLMAMWLGVWVGKGFEGIGLTLPTYIGAMLVGAVIRNVDDYTGWVKLSVPTTDLIGNICLALFLAIALMDLKLWELAGMGLPLLVNLVIQVAVVALFAVPIYWLMGRDYDAAVMGGGFIGFMLGTTANAMAVMRRLAQRYGPAPRAFLVAPLVGAFFIDFINALIITGFLNFWPH